MKISKRNIFRIIWFSLVLIFFIWNWSTYQSRELPENTFASTSEIKVAISDDKITFTPVGLSNKAQVIFFQGGLTDPKAYGPLCRKIAEGGFTCHLIKMDWRMPAWNYTSIKRMFNLETGQYIIGGHSQGAKMAAQFVYENPQQLSGLFLLGTSHPRDIDLSEVAIPTLKLYGTLDGLASKEEVLENKDKLPQNTDLEALEGANHSQFGYLGTLLTDNSAEISLKTQQQLTTKYLLAFFKKVQASSGD